MTIKTEHEIAFQELIILINASTYPEILWIARLALLTLEPPLLREDFNLSNISPYCPQVAITALGYMQFLTFRQKIEIATEILSRNLEVIN